jgi:hypothetical protein
VSEPPRLVSRVPLDAKGRQTDAAAAARRYSRDPGGQLHTASAQTAFTVSGAPHDSPGVKHVGCAPGQSKGSGSTSPHAERERRKKRAYGSFMMN